jgi:uncharacterized protein (DUF1684 family)
MRLIIVLTLVAAVGALAVGMACRKPADPPAAQPAAKAEQAVPVSAYEAEIRKFQQEHDVALTKDTGWLTIAGLFFLSQPETTFGADPLNDIVLPAGAPPRAGRFFLKDGKVSVKAEPGVSFRLGDKPFSEGPIKSDGEGPPDRLTLGDLQFWVHMSGERPSIRLRDKNSKLRQQFVGTSWFPVKEEYRVEAVYEPYAKPKKVQVPNILGDIDTLEVPGKVTFTLNGQQITMEPVDESTDYWFIFRDLTSGKETYPAARFLYADPPKNGRIVIDFNKAENPPCAYNPYATCPLPPEQNRLRLRVEAGEKNYVGHS